MLYKTKPILIEKVWGGSKLKDYNKIFEGNIGESIEYLGDLKTIPITIKLLNAEENLSIQVHPDESTAAKFGAGNIGKDEFWVILDCDKGSEIFYGFIKKYNKEELKKSLSDGSIIHILNKVKVKKGDCIFIPSGTVHALGKGIVAYEIQQSSNITYRLYDWNRGAESKREINVEKGIDSIVHFFPPSMISNIYIEMKKNPNITVITDCKHFVVRFIYLEAKESIMEECNNTKIITSISGIGAVRLGDKTEILKKGESCVITKNYDEYYEITAINHFHYIESTSK